MGEYVCFGEIMLRLKTPGAERFMQSPIMEATFGGGEANVAVSLANFGLDASYVTALPDNDLGAACVRELRGFGVNTHHVRRAPGRMGIYFLEAGANQRASKVVYDRADSSIALATRDMFDWESILSGVKWLHITGITPAISLSAASICEDAASAAKKLGVTFSCDLNFRKNLWKYGVSASEYMPKLMEYVDVCIANEEDFQKSLGIESEWAVTGGEICLAHVRDLLERVMKKYPNVKLIGMTLRESKNADHNDWSACLYDGNELYVSKKYEIFDIVDRVGGGDSFAAGLIYACNNYADKQSMVEFAAAASCLKHSISGDFNRVTVKEVEQLMGGDGSGRISR